jgi:predicted permease
MSTILLQMAVIGLCGVLWRWRAPAGLDADSTRRYITAVVYYLLLPALVLRVLWQAPLGVGSLKIALVAALAVGVGLTLQWLTCRLCSMARADTGALLLAAAFPNATYLGLPVLEKTLGPWARSVAIQYDLFACTPLLLTLGVSLAQTHGDGALAQSPLRRLAGVPALWAAFAAVGLNLAGGPMPEPVTGLLDQLAVGVSPLMLLAVGMGLRLDALRWRLLGSVLSVVLIQLLLMPLAAYGFARGVALQGDVLTAVVLEAAMPSMLLGIVLCDRFRLNTSLYAGAVTLSTLLSLLTLPLWLTVLGGPPDGPGAG